jgi:hypothetical protein
VLDSLDWTEPLVWAHTAFMGAKENIEDFGYGKGFKLADEHWRTLLDGLNALRANGMAVILIAHAAVKRFNAPDTDPYDRYQLKLHERAAGLVQEWADVVGFVHLETNTVTKDAGFNQKTTRGVTTGRRCSPSRSARRSRRRTASACRRRSSSPRRRVGSLRAGLRGAYATPDDEPPARTDDPERHRRRRRQRARTERRGARARASAPDPQLQHLAAGISPGGRHHHQASD